VSSSSQSAWPRAVRARDSIEAGRGAIPAGPRPWPAADTLPPVSEPSTASGRSPKAGVGSVCARPAGSFRMRAGASGRGASSATSSSIRRLDRCAARFRSASLLSGVKCGASFAIAVRWSRPSLSISSSIGRQLSRLRPSWPVCGRHTAIEARISELVRKGPRNLSRENREKLLGHRERVRPGPEAHPGHHLLAEALAGNADHLRLDVSSGCVQRALPRASPDRRERLPRGTP